MIVRGYNSIKHPRISRVVRMESVVAGIESGFSG
jgi:hypothetical protein